MEYHHISSERLSLEQLKSIFYNKTKLEISDQAKEKIIGCRNYLENKVATEKSPIYGVTTGFGSLCNTSISHQQLGELQENLVMSHACGMGEELQPEIVRLMLFLKIQSLSYGHSGVKIETVQRLVDMYNQDILPVVYNQGSLGASGDLAPLAHLSLPLLGMGEVWHKGTKRPSKDVLQEKNWKPLELGSKEGLALLNGTQFMAAIGSVCLFKAYRLDFWADLIGAMSLEAYDGRMEPFAHKVHSIRNHTGQMETAKRIRTILFGSKLMELHKNHVQDPYSFRCMPQVHGATKDAIVYVARVFEDEINAVTDNPTLFPEDDLIVSAGNFHGQPLAITLDFLGIALAELGNISERRVFKLISGTRNLPHFLLKNSGLNSGFMIPQYTAASIVSQNKQFCTPASIDSIDSSQGQEDHVSMGANAAVKTLKIVENLEKILAIELLNAAQALSFREFEMTSASLQNLLLTFRTVVPFVEKDAPMYVLMEKAKQFVINNDPAKFITNAGN
ncbi:MAG TPA: histidine ammonia-lyase [Bacteroidales bacterium]|nr:histidine ammonia-lyase [Bacteroidales bacterium]